MTKHCSAIVIALAVAACASNVEVRYPAPVSSPQTGSVLIRFTEPMRAVSVRIDGLLVAEDEHTERVHIAEVPTGMREITVVAAARDKAAPVDRSETVNVTAGQEAAILIATPPRSLGSWITSAAVVLVTGALLIAGDALDEW